MKNFLIAVFGTPRRCLAVCAVFVVVWASINPEEVRDMLAQIACNLWLAFGPAIKFVAAGGLIIGLLVKGFKKLLNSF